MIKENLWLIGVLLIVVGSFFISLFLLDSEEIHFMSDLIPYTSGFLITGLIASFFGFIFAILCLNRYYKAEIKPDNTTKIRVVLISVSVLYLTLIGYLMSIDVEWTVLPLIIELTNPSYGLHDGFMISSHGMFVVTLFMFGFFVLPFIITETGFLDDSLNEQNHNLEEDGYNPKNAEEVFDRFGAFLKIRIETIKKIAIIKNYTLPIALVFSILGSCLVGLPRFLFIDRQPIENPETGIVSFLDYKGFIRGQLLMIGLLFLTISLILIIQYKRRRPNSEKKTETF